LASASGPLSQRTAQAVAWAESQLTGSKATVEVTGDVVHFGVSVELSLLGGVWQPRVTASASSPIVDRVAWS
jgi:hypothetical protein